MALKSGEEENEPTILNPDQVAVIYDGEDGYQILLPDFDDDAEMPEQAALLVAAGLRLTSDEEFCEDLRRWLEQQQQ